MKKKVKKRFFAILLLLAIVFTNVGTDFFYVQASSIEANESVQEENTETITDTGTVEIGTDSVSDTEEVSESTETVEDTEKVDERTETVADTEVIDTEEDIPEEVTPEEEQIPDQEYTWRDTTVERNLYYDDWSKDNMGRIYLGETLEELFQMYEDPTLEMAGWEDFFAGTCFAGATLEDLKWLQESGYTMDQLIQIASDNNRSSVWQMLSGIALMAAYKDKTVAFTGATSTATIPALGRAAKFESLMNHLHDDVTREVNLALDNDEGGIQNAEKIKELIEKEGIDLDEHDWIPDYKDWNEEIKEAFKHGKRFADIKLEKELKTPIEQKKEKSFMELAKEEAKAKLDASTTSRNKQMEMELAYDE